jgi:hypothetical protein
MIIQKHIENLIFMLIIKLRQQTLILDKLWMRKHDVNYHEKTNIIEFYFEFCTHSRKIETTNKEKNFHFEKKFFSSQSDHVKLDFLNKNSKSIIVIKVLFRKEVRFDQSAINLSRKDKKSTTSINKSEILMRLKISDLILLSSKSLIRKRANHCSW